VEIIYGPVSSWRLGRSLGIDPICSREKICSFDCVYCSLGRTTEKTIGRRTFVPPEVVKQELKKALKITKPDVITFSGTGEPTLAKNLGKIIETAREVSSLPIAVLSNSTLWFMKNVRKDLAKADIVKGKLDASNDDILGIVNRPHEEISLSKIVAGLKKFRKEFDGRFAIEVMFVPENKNFSDEIADFVGAIEPDEVQINTPLRKSPATPLTRKELKKVEKSFQGINYRSVYEAKRPAEHYMNVLGEKKIRRLKRLK
jgi:wyosine [tRNA(Phe)-imidazoG37] synthetase (radical SAM superfamily)